MPKKPEQPEQPDPPDTPIRSADLAAGIAIAGARKALREGMRIVEDTRKTLKLDEPKARRKRVRAIPAATLQPAPDYTLIEGDEDSIVTLNALLSLAANTPDPAKRKPLYLDAAEYFDRLRRNHTSVELEIILQHEIVVTVKGAPTRRGFSQRRMYEILENRDAHKLRERSKASLKGVEPEEDLEAIEAEFGEVGKAQIEGMARSKAKYDAQQKAKRIQARKAKAEPHTEGHRKEVACCSFCREPVTWARFAWGNKRVTICEGCLGEAGKAIAAHRQEGESNGRP
jgi:hypothetical protein